MGVIRKLVDMNVPVSQVVGYRSPLLFSGSFLNFFFFFMLSMLVQKTCQNELSYPKISQVIKHLLQENNL